MRVCSAWRWLVAIGVCGLWVAAPNPARAQKKRVAIQDFTGPRSAGLRSNLAANLRSQSRIAVVDKNEVVRVARKFNINRRVLKRDEYVQVARELRIAAFMTGRVRRARRSWTLTVTVRNGVNGAVLGSASWSGRTVKALSSIRGNGYQRLVAYLSAAQQPSSEPPPPEPPPPVIVPDDPAVPGEGAGATPELPPPGPSEPGADGVDPDTGPAWYEAETQAGPDYQPGEFDPSATDAYDNEQAYGDVYGTGTEARQEPPVAPTGQAARYPWLSANLVAGLQYRMLTTDAIVNNNGRDPSGDAQFVENREYTSGGVGHLELGLDAEFFPGAIGDAQPFPYLGVAASVRKGLFLSTNTCRARNPPSDPCTREDTIDLPTDQYELLALARFRYRFGDEDRSPMVNVDVGYGLFAFTFDIETLAQVERARVVPPMEYSHVHMGAGLSYGIIPTYLTAAVRGAYKLGISPGLDAREVWGVDTTTFSGFQFELELTSEANYLVENLFFGVRFQYLQFLTPFRGQTRCRSSTGQCDPVTDPWEPWPTDPNNQNTVIGGLPNDVPDVYLRTQLILGYRFK